GRVRRRTREARRRWRGARPTPPPGRRAPRRNSGTAATSAAGGCGTPPGTSLEEARVRAAGRRARGAAGEQAPAERPRAAKRAADLCVVLVRRVGSHFGLQRAPAREAVHG